MFDTNDRIRGYDDELADAIQAERVRQDTWNRAIAGDVMLLTGSNRQFLAESPDGELVTRVKVGLSTTSWFVVGRIRSSPWTT